MQFTKKRFFNWERLPFGVIYAPLTFHWIYYILKSKFIWWFTPVNPTLQFGGFDGEGKKEMYEQLPNWSIPKTLFIDKTTAFNLVLQQIQENALTYPIIVKPNRGMQGVLFRIIERDEQLQQYHTAIPDDYIIQPFITYPIELSLFHVRYPNEPKGKVTGFIMKEYMHVVGDGHNTILHLIQQHPKAKYRMDEMTHKHGKRFHEILQKDELYYLSYAGNHNRGARFINLYNEIDADLEDLANALSNHAKHFYYGRYDIKCVSIDALKQKKDFAILEFNGAGAEPNHIYDCNMPLKEAYKVIGIHWKYMYEIGKINHKAGVPYWGLLKGWRFLRNANKHFKKMQQLDLTLKL
jgi:hypothetical protein